MHRQRWGNMKAQATLVKHESTGYRSHLYAYPSSYSQSYQQPTLVSNKSTTGTPE